MGAKIIHPVDPSNDEVVVEANKPPAKKPSNTSTRHNEMDVRHDESLGGIHVGLAFC